MSKHSGWIKVLKDGAVMMGSTRKTMGVTGFGRFTDNGFQYPRV